MREPVPPVAGRVLIDSARLGALGRTRDADCLAVEQRPGWVRLTSAAGSFDAQREAGEAYIRSQAGEGWTAVPEQYDDGGYTEVRQEGMSLRDYFAAKAMQGMLFGCVGTIGTSDEVSAYARGHCNAAVVDRAYAIADAMLAAREAGGK